MSTRFRLLASAAVPLIALPMMIPPVSAAPLMPMAAPIERQDVIHVQAAPDSGESDATQERRKKIQERIENRIKDRQQQKQQSGDAGAGAGAGADKPQRAQRPDNSQGNNGQGSNGQGNNAQRPQRQQPADDGAGQQQAPKPPRAPQNQTQDKANQPAQQGQESESIQNRRKQIQERIENRIKDRQQQKQQPADNGASGTDRSQGQNPGQNQGQTPGRNPAQNPAGTPNRPTPPGAAGSNDNTTPAGRPPRPQSGDDQNQGRPPADGQPSGARPPVAPGAGNQPQGQPQGTPLRGGQQPGSQPGTPPQPGQQNGARPQPDDQSANQPGGDRPGRPAQTARTPEQVERARQLARDPRAARGDEDVVLPVQNGAAVLDSAKQPNRRPLNDQAGQPGQSGRPPRNPAGDQPAGPPPRSDADAQGPGMSRQQEQQAVRDADKERGQRLDRRPKFERPNGWEVLGAAAVGAAVGYTVGQGQANQPPPPPGYGDRDDGRVFMRIDNQEVIRHDDSRRFYDDRRPPEYDQLSDGRVREVIVRDDGTRVVTIRNRYGEVVQRSRIVPGGQEYVLSYAPQLMNETRGPDYRWRDPGDDLPPMRLQVPLDDYIADASAQPNRDYYRFLEQPPVERVERVYSLDEVRYSARLRDKVRRIDLDTITFDTGSASISMNQAGTLRSVADGIKQVLNKDPSESFLIEGHTDAVGPAQDNLVLSDQRAESVARVLTDVYGIPPENMTTQGYGEEFLKVQTDGPNQENRRVTIRRITPLVRPVAQR